MTTDTTTEVEATPVKAPFLRIVTNEIGIPAIYMPNGEMLHGVVSAQIDPLRPGTLVCATLRVHLHLDLQTIINTVDMKKLPEEEEGDN